MQIFFDGWLDMFYKFLVCYVVSLSTEMKWAIIIISSHGCTCHNYQALIVYFCCGLLEVVHCVRVMKRPCNIKTAEMYYRDCSRWNARVWNCSSVGGGAEQRGSLIFHTSPWLEWCMGQAECQCLCWEFLWDVQRQTAWAERYSESVHITNTSHIASAWYMRFIIDLEWFRSLVLIQMQIWSTHSKMKEKIHQDSMWVYITLELQPDRSEYNTEI